MSVFAIIRNGIVANIVEAEDPAVLPLLLPDADDITEATEATGYPIIGGDVHGGVFRHPSPYESWVWSDAERAWVAPIPYPDDENAYAWDEDTQAWVVVVPPDPVLLPVEE